MRYTVEITEPAAENIESAQEWIEAESDIAAGRWIDGLLIAIESLAQFPLRCSLAPESPDHKEDIRQLIYGSYRILFVVRKRTVFVLHIRHASRDRATEEDVAEP